MSAVLILLLGLAIGSFLNVLIDRIPAGEDIVYGRSHCDYCKRVLRWYELIPVLSFVLQGARCRRCKKRLSFQYPFIEFVTAVTFLLVYRSVSGPFPGFLHILIIISYLAVASSLIVIFVIDWKHQIIPDSMLIVGWVAAIPLFLVRGVAGMESSALTALLSVAFFYALWRVTKGRGLGYGDVKLSGFLGAVAGHPYALIGFYVAFLTGAIYGVILMTLGKAGMKSRIAFGPFLIGGIAAAFYVGPWILRWLGMI